jgi:hypothetical protein
LEETFESSIQSCVTPRARSGYFSISIRAGIDEKFAETLAVLLAFDKLAAR